MRIDPWKFVPGTFVFLFSLILYLATLAPSVSFWDCGEFIAAAYTLGVSHPPGNPLFLLLGRIFTLFSWAADPAFRVNLMSPLSAALANLLVFLIVLQLVSHWRKGLRTVQDKFIAITGACIGALLFAATDSHWFNAVETEVYAMSTFSTALVVWLGLLWAEKADSPGNERYLLLIAYILGLGIGIHSLNLLALPALALIIYFKKYEFHWRTFTGTIIITLVVFLMIYSVIIKGLPRMASLASLNNQASLLPVGLVVLGVFAGAYWAVKNGRKFVSLTLFSTILILVGYSSYTLLYIRANQDPMINENDPSTLERMVSYLEMEQYGQHSIVDRKSVWQDSVQAPGSVFAEQVNSTAGFIWNYQINHMYLRYFYWQFLGRSGDKVNPLGYLLMPFVLGIFGMYYHFGRDSKRGLVILSLFIMTGLAIVLYLNQPEPQPRERDYAYVGSFMAFSIWIGIGASGLMELILDRVHVPVKRILAGVTIVLLVVALPLQMIAKNYHTHNRSGNYFARDFAYNLLQTCEPDAILFTRADNDSFPLWYLQEVEGIRTDVRVVTLELLNTHWYIKQMRDYLPSILPKSLSDAQIESMLPRQYQERTIQLRAPRSAENSTGRITFTMPPTYQGQFIRTQDLALLRIIRENLGKRPIYFATTMPDIDMLGLNKYLRLDGMAYRLMPYKVNGEIEADLLEHNLTKKFQYRNLGDPKVYYNDMIKAYAGNYRVAFMELARNYLESGDRDSTLRVLDKMNSSVPEDTLPHIHPQTPLRIGSLYAGAGRPNELETRLYSVLNDFQLNLDQKIQYGMLLRDPLEDYKGAKDWFGKLFRSNPENGQIAGILLLLYRETDDLENAVSLLKQWLKTHPGDKEARRLLQSYQTLLKSSDTIS